MSSEDPSAPVDVVVPAAVVAGAVSDAKPFLSGRYSAIARGINQYGFVTVCTSGLCQLKSVPVKIE